MWFWRPSTALELPQLQELEQHQTLGAALSRSMLFQLVIAMLLGSLLTWLSIVLMRRAGRIDAPAQSAEDRRLHQVPTPRGGMLGIALLVVAAALFLRPPNAFFLVPCMAVVGLLDDLSPQPAILRLALQVVIALMAVITLGDPWPEGPVLWVRLLLVLSVVWIVNACNFFDGANGLLTGMALWFLLAVALLGLANAHVAWWMGLLLGFLVWNFPNAKVFMGDVGSYLVGGLLAWMFLRTAQRGLLPILTVLCLMAPILFDTTFTLLARLFRGERVWQAHREHTYQYLMRAGFAPTKLLLHYLFYGFMSTIAAWSITKLPETAWHRVQIAVFLLWSALSWGLWWIARAYAMRQIDGLPPVLKQPQAIAQAIAPEQASNQTMAAGDR